MKITLITLSIFCLTISNVLGQVKLSEDFTLTAGTPYDVFDASDKQYFGVENDMLISIKTLAQTVLLQKFDATEMKEVYRKEYEDFPKGMSIQRIFQLPNGNLNYIYQSYDSKLKSFSLHSRIINAVTCEFEKPVLLFSTSRKVTKSGFDTDGKRPITIMPNLNSGVQFATYQSDDKTKTLVQYRLTPENRKDVINKDDLGFYVFDENSNLLWGNEFQMPYTEAEMNNLAYMVSNNGNVFMLAYLRESKTMELFQLNDDGLNVHKLNVDGELIFEALDLLELSNGNIVCTGYYASGYDFKGNFNGGGMSTTLSFNTDGIYSFTTTPTGELSDVRKIEFSLELVKQYLTDEQQKKLVEREKDGKAGIPDLKITDFYAQADGSYIIVGEQQFLRNEMVITSSAYVNHYDNIVIAKINDTGDLVWIKKLPKRQHGSTGENPNYYYEGQMSFNYFYNSGEHFLIFVDNPKNANLSENQIPEGHKNLSGGYLSAFIINDETGKTERHTIAPLENLDGMDANQFKITRIEAVNANTFLLEVYIKKKQDCMIKIETEK